MADVEHWAAGVLAVPCGTSDSTSHVRVTVGVALHGGDERIQNEQLCTRGFHSVRDRFPFERKTKRPLRVVSYVDHTGNDVDTRHIRAKCLRTPVQRLRNRVLNRVQQHVSRTVQMRGTPIWHCTPGGDTRGDIECGRGLNPMTDNACVAPALHHTRCGRRRIAPAEQLSLRSAQSRHQPTAAGS